MTVKDRGKPGLRTLFPHPAKAPRRGKRAKLHDMPSGEMSVTDAFFPGGEDLAASVTDSVPSEPAKARRGRKPKSQPTPEPVTTAGHPTREISTPAAGATSVEGNERLDVVGGHGDTLPARRKRRGGHEQVDVPATTDASAASTALQPSAAEWDDDTGTATFDWPSIEHVAATEGPNQAMAKLLLAARAEGGQLPLAVLTSGRRTQHAGGGLTRPDENPHPRAGGEDHLDRLPEAKALSAAEMAVRLLEQDALTMGQGDLRETPCIQL